MLSNKAGVRLDGNKSSNQSNVNVKGDVRKVGVNSPTYNNADKSFVSTNHSQNKLCQTSFNQGKGGQRANNNLNKNGRHD